MKAVKNILYEVYKNFRLIFRNWSSLLLIVLAPLFLILVVGYSFSGEYLHDIKIGVVADSSTSLDDFARVISGFGTVARYSSTEQCVYDMVLEKAHMCIEIKGSLIASAGAIPTGEVNFYYDNTRKRISLLLLSEMKDYFGLTSERISLISTQEIIDNMQNLLSFLNQRIDDVGIVKNESYKIMDDLRDRKQKLIETRDDFTPKYLLVKSAQADVNNYSDEIYAQTATLQGLVDEVDSAASSITGQIALLNDTGIDTTQLAGSISNLESEMENITATADSTADELRRMNSSMNDVVVELDNINLLLNEEIGRTDEYIMLINESTMKIEKVSSEAREKMKDLSEIDPSLASKIANPISQSFTALIKDVRDIQLAFPVLLSMVIVFISLIFSNIITSLEINDKAYIRNILAPVDDIVYTTGIAITNFIIISFQVAVLLAVAQARFGIDIVMHLNEIIPITAVLVLIFIFAGMILAYLSRNIQNSILTATFVALAVFLISDALNSLEAMPKLAATIAAFNPVVVVDSMLRQILFFNIGIEGLKPQLGLLVIYMAAAAFLLVGVSKIKNKRRL